MKPVVVVVVVVVVNLMYYKHARASEVGGLFNKLWNLITVSLGDKDCQQIRLVDTTLVLFASTINHRVFSFVRYPTCGR